MLKKLQKNKLGKKNSSCRATNLNIEIYVFFLHSFRSALATLLVIWGGGGGCK